MLETPTGIIATAVLALAIATSIGIVLYAISLVMRANQPAETPENLLAALSEAIRTLGRASELLSRSGRDVVRQGPDLLGSNKAVSTPLQVVMEKIMIILNTPTKERTHENFAFLQHYITGKLVQTMIKLGHTNADAIETFAMERRTPQETRTHLLTALHDALTSDDTDSLPVIPDGPGFMTEPARAKGRSTVAQPPDQGRVVASGQVVVDARPNGHAS